MEKEELKRRYIINGIVEDITATTKEEPLKTTFGSTDRKGYTLKTVLNYMGNYKYYYTNIEPYSKINEEIVKATEEKMKHEFAKEIYNKEFE